LKAVPLPPGWGVAALFEVGEEPWSGPGTVRSHDHGGAVLAWRPTGALHAACDMEREDVDCSALASRFAMPPPRFLEAWTAAETTAKITRMPVLLLARSGLAPSRPGILVQRHYGRIMAFQRVPT
jgi:hypothetical protein